MLYSRLARLVLLAFEQDDVTGMRKQRRPLRMFDSIENESATIQLAQCRFPELAISNAKILIFFK